MPSASVARRVAAVVFLVAAASCGGSSTGEAPVDGGTGPNPFPAPHPQMPLVAAQGGPILMNPQLITVTFQGDTLAPQLDGFSDAMPASTWWSQVSSDYQGIGALTSAAHVSITQAASAAYTDSVMGGASTIDEFLQQNVTDGVLPDPTAQTIYLVYMPPSTMVSLDGQSSCVDGGFAGYHKSTGITPKAGGAAVDASYAIVVRCAPPVPQLMMSEQTYMTISGSHEIIEAATDGKPISQGFAWAMGDLGWGIFGPEVADLCADTLGTGQDQWSEGAFTYQRSWSNSSAKAGKDPCVPIPSSEVYFNAAPQLHSCPGVGGCVTLSVGGSTAPPVELDAFSDADLPAWQIKALDVGAAVANMPSALTLTLDKTTVKNGDIAHLTIQLNTSIPAYPGNFPAKTTVVYVVSLVDTTNAHFWPIVVQEQ
jgi:hypothetical protein